MANYARVVKDITNPGSQNIDGKMLTQLQLKRVDPGQTLYVQHMLRAACCRLLGKESCGPSTVEEAWVWNAAAKFLGRRIQGSAAEMPDREPDMSSASAAAMRTVLGQIEVASKLIANREFLIKDITNPGPRGVRGGSLSQRELKRLDAQHQPLVDAMLSEVSSRLLGKGVQMITFASISDSAGEKVKVWAQAAAFLASRIQDSSSNCDRPNDMSDAAARELRTTLGQLEAAHMLISNCATVAQDITNLGEKAVGGGELTQTNLTRLDSKHKASVTEMLHAVSCRLLGQGVSGPSPQDSLVWAEAAVYLSGRIQSSSGECPGRARDMSRNAARAMRKVLGEIEASSRLMSNRENVSKDITNPGPSGVLGGQLTQRNLKRVDSNQQASVDQMLRELCCRLLGKKTSEPSTPEEAQVWADAATFFSSRIQSSSFECQGRAADMSREAASALRMELSKITAQSDKIDTHSLEAAQKLMFNAERVVDDITNPGPKNIDRKLLTQTDLKRVDAAHRVSVDQMIGEVCCRLVGKSAVEASTPEEKNVWAEAAKYLSGRIQGTPEEMKGRDPDMSSGAAAALRKVLAQI